MALKIGIVGLPNVGKSTLFNAITKSCVQAENYPFCTIDPHSGIVPIPDKRLDSLSKVTGSKNIIGATIEFVDIAGLVRGASKGEGLGNKFLTNIRETNAIVHMVRCFEDSQVIHVEGKVAPMDDIETINTELLLSDYEVAEKLVSNQIKRAKTNQKDEVAKLAVFERIKTCLGENKPVRSLTFSDAEQEILSGIHFLSQKKVIYVANITENMVNVDSELVTQVKQYADSQNDSCVVLCAKLESELATLDDEDKQEFLDEFGMTESGLGVLANACFKLLGLQTYLTSGEKETRAWTIDNGSTAPQAAGVIHTDFEKGFIRANIVPFQTFIDCGGWKGAKDKGLVKQEGKEYIMRDGDVVEFLFNV